MPCLTLVRQVRRPTSPHRRCPPLLPVVPIPHTLTMAWHKRLLSHRAMMMGFTFMCAAQEAIQAHRANQGKTLGQLRGSLISLDQWIISTPMACSNPKTAPSWNRFARTISDSLNPICLQSSAFTSLGAGESRV